jgi:D-sedoheptulose 7-phosphate isomerase
MSFTQQFLDEAKQILDRLDVPAIEKMVALLAETRARGGRLFILGVGGSAANASHAVNDFRKLAGFEAYAPSDNVSELTARTNDEGWETVFEAWLRVSRLRSEDLLLVLSVGGGDVVRRVSTNLVFALKYAKSVGAKVAGIVGRGDGYTAQVADACRTHHTACGGVSGGGVALLGLASRLELGPDQMGILGERMKWPISRCKAPGVNA